MHEIKPDNPIFDSDAYKADSVPFFVLTSLKESGMSLLVKGDNDRYVIGSAKIPGIPTWIWSDDSLSDDDYREIKAVLDGIFVDDYKPVFVAKPKLAARLSESYGKPASVLFMNAYECRRINPLPPCDAIIRSANEGDIETLALINRNFLFESSGRESRVEEHISAAEMQVKKCRFAFVAEKDGKVVAYAKNARSSQSHTSINSVYTFPEYRRRGYAAALSAHISRLILEAGKIPLLYADIKNPASNKAYRNVGFELCGMVDQYDY